MAKPFRESLAEARERGVPFDRAWPTAFEELDWSQIAEREREEWEIAFRACRRDFAAAYAGRGTKRASAVAKLAA